VDETGHCGRVWGLGFCMGVGGVIVQISQRL